MYYAALPAGAAGSPSQGLEKTHPHHQVAQQALYLPPTFNGTPSAPSGFAPAAAAAHPVGQPMLRYAPQPAYAVVSQAGYPAMSPATYHSVPTYSGMQAPLPATSTAYISAGQYPGLVHPNALASRSGSTHFQAGAPLIAAGYPAHIHAGAIPAQPHAPQVAAHAPRHYQVAAYPPGYPHPAGSTVPIPYGAAAFGPPYQ